MSTEDIYGLDVCTFAELIATVFSTLQLLRISKGSSVMYSTLIVEIKCLKTHLDVMRELGNEEWRDKLPQIVELSKKLERKEQKLSRYIKEFGDDESVIRNIWSA